jgi:hypothetical protein
MAAFNAGSSNVAQRGSWKLFHDTPTTHAAGAGVAGAAVAGAALGAAGLLQAAIAKTTLNKNAAIRRMDMLLLLLCPKIPFWLNRP